MVSPASIIRCMLANQSAKRRVRRFVIAFVLTFLVAYVDVLGIHSNLESLSEVLAQRTLAGWYQYKEPRDKIIVVLIDDRYVDGTPGRRPGWPLPAEDFLRNILDPIIDAGPAAVFVDMSFTDMPRRLSASDRDFATQAALAELGDGFREASRKTPILLGDVPVINDGPSTSCDRDWIDQEAIALGRTTAATFIDRAFGVSNEVANQRSAQLEMVAANWIGPPTEYPLATALVSPRGSCRTVWNRWETDHREANTIEGSLPGRYLISPAAAIVSRLCQPQNRSPLFQGDASKLCDDIHRTSDPSENAGFGLYEVSENLDRRIAVQWGTHQSEQAQWLAAARRDADKCVMQDDEHLLSDSLVQAFYAFLPGMAEWIAPDKALRPCFYFTTLSAADIRDPANLGRVGKDPVELLSGLLHNKVVMIGTQVRTVRDTVVEPLGIEVPGVFLHAMALDNLLARGEQYPRRAEGLSRLIGFDLVEALCVALAGLLLDGLVVRLQRHSCLPAGRHAQSFLGLARILAVLVVLTGLVFLIALSASLILGQVLHYPYFGSPIYVALALAVLLGEELGHACFQEHHGG